MPRQPATRKGLIACSQRAQKLIFESSEFNPVARAIKWIHDPVNKEQFRDLGDQLATVEVLFSSWSPPRLDAECLARMPALQAVFYAGGSVKGIVSPDFWKLDIPVFNTKLANAVPVAEYCFSQIILGLKRAGQLSRYLREERGFPREMYQEHHLETCPFHGAFRQPVGLIGLGVTGRQTAALLRQSDLQLLGFDPFVTQTEMARSQVDKVELEDLFRRSCAVSLHAPELESTRWMIRGHHLLSMPRHGVFINTSRGGLVHQDEMIDALRKRPDLWAVLDVTEPEPLLPDSPLLSMPNVEVTPHIAGALGSEMNRLAREICREYFRWLKQVPTHSRVYETDLCTQA